MLIYILLLLHSAFMLCMVKMLLKGEVEACALKSHGNYIVDHGKSWKNHGIVFLNFCGTPYKKCNWSRNWKLNRQMFAFVGLHLRVHSARSCQEFKKACYHLQTIGNHYAKYEPSSSKIVSGVYFTGQPGRFKYFCLWLCTRQRSETFVVI